MSSWRFIAKQAAHCGAACIQGNDMMKLFMRQVIQPAISIQVSGAHDCRAQLR
jgi:hypothetical protein